MSVTVAQSVGPPVDTTHLPDSIGHHIDRLAQRWPDAELLWVPAQGAPVRTRFAEIWQLAVQGQGYLESRWPERPPIRAAAPSLAARVAQVWSCYRGGFPVVLAPTDHPSDDLPPGTQTWPELTPAPTLDHSTPSSAAHAPTRIATYALTSGTTGRARFACFTQEATRYSCCNVDIDAFNPEKANLTLFAPHTATGLVVFFPRAARIVCLDPLAFLASPSRLFDLIERERVRYLAVSSSQAGVLNQVLQFSPRRWDLSSLTHLGTGIEAIVPTVFRELRQRLGAHRTRPLMIPGYGMTETGVICHVRVDAPEIDRWFLDPPPVCVGPPAPGWHIRVVDADEQLLPEGEEGHLQVFSREELFSGYVGGEPGDTEAAFTADDWFRTGDLGVMRNGQITVTGRAKELLIINGANIAPQRIEQVLQGLPGILSGQVYAYPVRGPQSLTDELGIVFVPDPAQTPEHTCGLIQRTLAAEWRLQARELRAMAAAELPRTSTGKVRRLAMAAAG